ncbi:MAG: hypothetical protein R3B06_06245 [Kofleriaceae bacterium]
MIGVGLALTLAACGGSATPPPAQPAPADVCVADPALAANRRPKPPEVGCMDQAAYLALGDACNADDPDACYQIAVCIKAQELGVDMAAAERTQHQTAILQSLRRSCDAGIAEACTLRVGMQMIDDAPLPADGCADMIRACNLGDEQGCAGCRWNQCNG